MTFDVTADQINQLVPSFGGTDYSTLFDDNIGLIEAFLPGHSGAEDSHFLFGSADATVVYESSQGEKVTFENGTTLAGLFAFTGARKFSSMNIAQVVVPASGDVAFNVQLGALDQSGNPLGGRFSGVIPEPATLSLLGFGGLAVIRRRRWTRGNFGVAAGEFPDRAPFLPILSENPRRDRPGSAIPPPQFCGKARGPGRTKVPPNVQTEIREV